MARGVQCSTDCRFTPWLRSAICRRLAVRCSACRAPCPFRALSSICPAVAICAPSPSPSPSPTPCSSPVLPALPLRFRPHTLAVTAVTHPSPVISPRVPSAVPSVSFLIQIDPLFSSLTPHRPFHSTSRPPLASDSSVRATADYAWLILISGVRYPTLSIRHVPCAHHA